ncbi:hypothetical protein [Brevibacillus laterosporus]|uniref:hypothetical protein n=1 Tax=Brevibacillus laterosporus TaxID=1465 RepID=UPI002656B877|nr:hypothetical protein [Brevibacillus laterosporus]MDN9012401.1 hypothetical protein [Brevibacillus laterosporus]MDO0943536.1 hypothetical protein [Brevibacillus laterosporus]
MNERYVDHETGEILEERRLLLRSNEIVKVINPYATGGRNTKFVKSKTSQKAKRRFYQLNVEEEGFLSKISRYATPGRNLLVGDGERGMKGKSLTTKQLFQICRLSKQRGYKILKTLLDYNCLKLTEYGYVINPDYYINGKAPDPALLKYFRSESEQEGGRDHGSK